MKNLGNVANCHIKSQGVLEVSLNYCEMNCDCLSDSQVDVQSVQICTDNFKKDCIEFA